MPTALERLKDELGVLKTRLAVEQEELKVLNESPDGNYGAIRMKKDEIAATQKLIDAQEEEIRMEENRPDKDGPDKDGSDKDGPAPKQTSHRAKGPSRG